MSAENMSAKQLEKANKLYELGVKSGMKLYNHFIGTTFVVNRPLENSKWKNVFGGSYSSDSTLENDYEQFETTLLINMNDMRDIWARNRDNLEVMSEKGDLQVGDELQYTREGLTYRFKIIMKQSFSEAAKALFAYTLSSIIETKDM